MGFASLRLLHCLGTVKYRGISWLSGAAGQLGHCAPALPDATISSVPLGTPSLWSS